MDISCVCQPVKGFQSENCIWLSKHFVQSQQPCLLMRNSEDSKLGPMSWLVTAKIQDDAETELYRVMECSDKSKLSHRFFNVRYSTDAASNATEFCIHILQVQGQTYRLRSAQSIVLRYPMVDLECKERKMPSFYIHEKLIGQLIRVGQCGVYRGTGAFNKFVKYNALVCVAGHGGSEHPVDKDSGGDVVRNYVWVTTSTQVLQEDELPVYSLRTSCVSALHARLAVERVVDPQAVLSLIGSLCNMQLLDTTSTTVKDTGCDMSVNRGTSILLEGASGTGKTSVLCGLAHRYQLSCVGISIGKLIAKGKEYADKELFLCIQYALALQSPVMIILEDLDLWLPSTNGDVGNTYQAVDYALHTMLLNILKWIKAPGAKAAQTCTSLFSLTSYPPIVLVGCCSSINKVDAAIQSNFVEHISMSNGYPLTEEEKLSVVKVLLTDVVVPALPSNDCSGGLMSSRDAFVHALYSMCQASFIPTLSMRSTGDHVSLPTGLPAIAFAIRCTQILQRCYRQLVTHKDSRDLNAGGLGLDTPAMAVTKPIGLGNTRNFASAVAGHSDVKQSLVESMCYPKRFYKRLLQLHLTLEVGVLLYGPPGTGKTLLVRSVASELSYTLLSLSIPKIVHGELGAGEEAVRLIFQQAKAQAPCIVFIDEFQALFTSREDNGDDNSTGSTLTSALAGCMDDVGAWNCHAGAQSLIHVMAATNEPWAVDAGFLRGGRFDRCVYVGVLDRAGRQQLLSTLLGVTVHCNQEQYQAEDTAASTVSSGTVGITQMELMELIDRSEGYTGADLVCLVQRAKRMLCASCYSDQRHNTSVARPCVLMSHLTAALTEVAPSVSSTDLHQYTSWRGAGGSA